MIRRLLDLLPHDTLVVGGAPYMRRWYVLGYAPGDLNAPVGSPGNTRSGRWWRLPFAVRIHEIVASDDSRAFHDHPWPFVSILLRGAYDETTPAWSGPVVLAFPTPDDERNPVRRFSAPAVNIKSAEDLHVLTIPEGGRSVWTLFLTARKRRTWGFAGPFGWIGWREFDDAFPGREAWTEPGR